MFNTSTSSNPIVNVVISAFPVTVTDAALSAAAEVLEVSAENELAGFSAATLQSHLDYVKGEVDLAVFSSQAVEILDRLGRLDQLESQFDDLLEQEKLAALKELAYGASHEP